MKKIRYMAIVLALGSQSCTLLSDFGGYRFDRQSTTANADSSFYNEEAGSFEADSGEPEYDASEQESGYAEIDSGFDSGLDAASGAGGSGGHAGEPWDAAEAGQGGMDSSTGGSAGSAGDGGSAGEAGTGGEAGSAGESGTGSTAGEAGTGGSGGTEECIPETDCWYDSNTGLYWQRTPPGDRYTWDVALVYCDSLELGGHKDWRAPKIQELKSLIRGCDIGDCLVTDPDCLTGACGTTCNTCSPGVHPGPGVNGCYWDAALEGLCADVTDRFWSSSVREESSSEARWSINFWIADVVLSQPSLNLWIRCVRP